MNVAVKVKPIDSMLARTPPFLTQSKIRHENVLLLDSFELPLGTLEAAPDLFAKLCSSLDLRPLGSHIPPSVFADLLVDQYASAAEFVYGHPFWSRIRDGSKSALFAYILETRHYLAAASLRMSPSIGAGVGLSPLTLLLAKHLLEEWDHAIYFSDALEMLGCPLDLTSHARPLPVTLEWIHLSRALASIGGIAPAICSGFMEYTSQDIESVNAWHEMLVASGLLPIDANRSLRRHVETDVAYAHADNWRRAVDIHGSIKGESAAALLNNVCALAEMIHRWLSSMEEGLSASMTIGMQALADEQLQLHPAENQTPLRVHALRGMPVHGATLLDFVSWRGNECISTAGIVSSLCYGFGHATHQLRQAGTPFTNLLVDTLVDLNLFDETDLSSAKSIEATTASWTCSIDGHTLWDRMVDAPTDGLINGYLLENYHYLASAAHHVSAAISSCTNPVIAGHLIRHLQDELTHCDILKDALIQFGNINTVETMRPLPTTIAFIGYLQSLGVRDWKAYIVASTFLQKSLSELRTSRRNSQFYKAVMRENPSAGAALNSIWNHDALDDDLDHDNRPSMLISELLTTGPLSVDSLGQAAVVPSLAWSFFDGIATHYGRGGAVPAQRIGWRVC